MLTAESSQGSSCSLHLSWQGLLSPQCNNKCQHTYECWQSKTATSHILLFSINRSWLMNCTPVPWQFFSSWFALFLLRVLEIPYILDFYCCLKCLYLSVLDCKCKVEPDKKTWKIIGLLFILLVKESLQKLARSGKSMCWRVSGRPGESGQRPVVRLIKCVCIYW